MKEEIEARGISNVTILEEVTHIRNPLAWTGAPSFCLEAFFMFIWPEFHLEERLCLPNCNIFLPCVVLDSGTFFILYDQVVLVTAIIPWYGDTHLKPEQGTRAQRRGSSWILWGMSSTFLHIP